MSDLQELVRVLTKRELDILMLEQNPVFMYVQVSAAEKMLKEIERLREALLTCSDLATGAWHTIPSLRCASIVIHIDTTLNGEAASEAAGGEDGSGI